MHPHCLRGLVGAQPAGIARQGYGLWRVWPWASMALGLHRVAQWFGIGCGNEMTWVQNLVGAKDRWKWFKDRHQGYVKLMRCNSGFGWDLVMKTFTASDELWEEYFKSHPNQRHYQTDTFTDYDDLRIIVENATALGRYLIELGDDSDARTFEAEETCGDVLEDLTYDYDAEAFVQRNEHQQKSLNQTPTVGIFNAPPTIEPMNLEVHSVTKKRNRTEKE
ncbi:hypothetical protein Syun_018624 [Stephania yunnanensis]|uniref:Myb/SANT-like domain-containing protein n=1 Tax=Stephania yunnanensis TaxID=152371 RepID=A0AAP0IUI1_9MAGN